LHNINTWPNYSVIICCDMQ